MMKWSYEEYKFSSCQQVRTFKNLQALGLLSLSNYLKYNTDSFVIVCDCCCYDVIIIIKVSISVFGDLMTVC
jgi:hypothetical protein